MPAAYAPGWPVVLHDPYSGVLLRPHRRSDAAAWSSIRIRNRKWLKVWEPTSVRASWEEINSPEAFKSILRELRHTANQGSAMPFAVCLRQPDGSQPLVGQMSLGSIVRRAFSSAYAGYWIDSAFAGRGAIPTALALAVDHAFTVGELHRVEVNIRPDNRPSRRVVEKLGFREEAYHVRYLHIDGEWRDHIGYALTIEDVQAEGGLLARWNRLRGVGSVASRGA